MIPRTHRHAFTLVEVAIATMVLVVACLVVLMLLPGALKTQQLSRYRMLAAAHANNLIEGFYQHDFQDLRSFYVSAWNNPKPVGPDTRLDWKRSNPTHWQSPMMLDRNDRGIKTELMQRKLLSDPGMYDLERQVANPKYGNYPLPLAIARRLDSPNDEIRQILDDGGYIYYTDAKIHGLGDINKILWGVVGHAQQNLLPFDPCAQPFQELYPFPPIARPRIADRQYVVNTAYNLIAYGNPVFIPKGGSHPLLQNNGSSSWDAGAPMDMWLQEYRPVPAASGPMLRAVDPVLRDELYKTGSHSKEDSYYQRNNWEWLAWRQAQGDTDVDVRWSRSLDAYRSLVQRHWLRIHHQIDTASSNQPSVTVPGTNRSWSRTRQSYDWVPEKDGQNQVVRDELGQAVMVKVDAGSVTETFRTRGDDNGPGGAFMASGVADMPDLFKSWRGYPAPANGLPTGHLRGTDILEEDAAANVHDLAQQLQVSLPSLERRVMYRSAALALWAATAYGKDIRRGEDDTRIYLEVVDRTGARRQPTITAADLALGKTWLAIEENPLYQEFALPGPQDLHPTMVLAASHLAHAAVMVTGYKHPFYTTNNTASAEDDLLLVAKGSKNDRFGIEEERLPFRAVEGSCIGYQDRQDTRPGQVMVRTPGDSFVPVTVDPLTGRIDLSAIVTHDQLHHPELGTITDIDPDTLNPIASTNPVVIYPWRNTYLWNPYHVNVMSTSSQPHVSQTPLSSGSPVDHQLDASGRPIQRRRNTGTIINGFPPPYADEQAIGLDGQRTYEITYTLDVVFSGHYRHDDSWRALTKDDALIQLVVVQPWQDATKSAVDINFLEAVPQADVGGRAVIDAGPFYIWIYNDYDAEEDSIADYVPPPDSVNDVVDTFLLYDGVGGESGGQKIQISGKDVPLSQEALLLLDRKVTPTYRLLRTFDAAIGELRDDDSAVARVAHEHALLMAMSYVNENPYDLTVPKPYNRQSFIDRGVYAYDLFDGSGNSRRPSATNFNATNPITFPVDANRHDRARWGAQWGETYTVDSVADFLSQHKIPASELSPRDPDPVANTGYPFGLPHGSLPGNSEFSGANAYKTPDNLQKWYNRLHGYDWTPKVQGVARDAGRFNHSRPFEAEHRARQLVYWLVDWQQFDDFESAPSTPTDQSQLQRSYVSNPYNTRVDFQCPGVSSEFATLRTTSNLNDSELSTYFYNGATLRITCESQGFDAELIVQKRDGDELRVHWMKSGLPFDNPSFEATLRQWRTWQLDANAAAGSTVEDCFKIFYDATSDQAVNDAGYLAGNPEEGFTWVDPERTSAFDAWSDAEARVDDSDSRAAGDPAYRAYWVPSGHPSLPLSDWASSFQKQGGHPKITGSGRDQMVLRVLGSFGADRNRNGVFDRGPVPSSTRMDAAEIARFTYYDPVLWLSLRR